MSTGGSDLSRSICDEGRDCDCDCDLRSAMRGELRLRRASYGDDNDGRVTAIEKQVLGFWFGFAVLLQRLCIRGFFFFDKHSILLLVCFAFAL